MPQVDDLSRSLVSFDQETSLIVVVEMSQSSWLVAGMIPGVDRLPPEKLVPDPDGLLLAYLPSRSSEGGASGLSQSRALAICRRMVAVHCLYGVDSNRLAVERKRCSTALLQ